MMSKNEEKRECKNMTITIRGHEVILHSRKSQSPGRHTGKAGSAGDVPADCQVNTRRRIMPDYKFKTCIIDEQEQYAVSPC